MEIFKLFGSIFVNTDDAENSISKTDKKASGFASTLGNGIKTAAKWGLGIATAAAGMAAAVGGALITLTDNTREYRTEMGKLETAYTTAGLSSEQATQTYKSLQAVLGETDTAVEAANHLAKLCDTQEELNKWTDICTGVFATFGDSLPIEGLTEAANETAKVGQVTGPLADALNWAGISEDKFNESLAKCTSEQERQALITETLNDLYSEASEKYKEVNKDVMNANAANEKITSTIARFGAIAEPIVTMAKVKFAEFLETLVPLADKVADFTEKFANGEINISSFGDKLGSMFSPEFKESMMWYINTAFPNMFEHLKNSAVENFKGKLSGLSEIFIKLKDIVQPFVELYIAQLIDTILIAIDLISSVVIPTLGFLFDAFTQIAGTILDSVQPALSSIIDSFSSLYMIIYEAISDYIIPTLEMFIDMIKQLWEENQDKINLIGELFKTVFDLIAEKVEWFVGVVQEYIYPLFIWFVETVQNNMDIIKNIFQSVFDMIGGIIQFFIALFKGDWSGMWEAIKIILDGAFSFIKNIFELISAFIGSIGDAIKEKVKKAFENIKTSMVSQISEAKDSVVKTFTAIKNAIEEKIDAAKEIVSTGIEKIKSFFDFEWSLPKLKLPHFNISGEFSLKPPSVPSFGVEWYKDGGVMTQPTAFGFNPLTGKVMGGGEVEPEAIAPISVLQEYVKDAVSGQNQDIVAVLNLILQGIYALGERLGILENLQLVLDSGALVGEIANKMDSELGTIVSWKERNG